MCLDLLIVICIFPSHMIMWSSLSVTFDKS
jgi:hypothetical protein